MAYNATEEPVAYSGIAKQRANVKFARLAKSMKPLKAMVTDNPEMLGEELTKILYPEWEEMTLEDFEGKVWYVQEKLIPILDKSDQVYDEMIEEEQAKLLDIDQAKTKLGW